MPARIRGHYPTNAERERERANTANERSVVERCRYTSYKDNAFKCHTSTEKRDLLLINFQRFLPLWKTVGGRSTYGLLCREQMFNNDKKPSAARLEPTVLGSLLPSAEEITTLLKILL